MPQPIYMQRHPTFMEQFLSTGIMENIMKGIQMRNQNKRADAANIQGLQQQGYSEADYTAPTPQEVQAGYRGAAPGQYQGKTFDPSQQVEVAGRRFQRPPAPKAKWKLVEKNGQLFSVTTQADGKINAKPVNKKNTDPTLVKEYKFAQTQFENGVGKDPGDFTTYSRRQRKSGATRIGINEKVQTNRALQISKMQTGIRSPAFKEKATKFIMSQPDADLLEPNQVELKVREEMLRRIQNLHPGKKVVFDLKNNKLGYYVDGKLVRLAE